MNYLSAPVKQIAINKVLVGNIFEVPGVAERVLQFYDSLWQTLEGEAKTECEEFIYYLQGL